MAFPFIHAPPGDANGRRPRNPYDLSRRHIQQNDLLAGSSGPLRDAPPLACYSPVGPPCPTAPSSTAG